jgi:hypothetical protein
MRFSADGTHGSGLFELIKLFFSPGNRKEITFMFVLVCRSNISKEEKENFGKV